MGSRAGPTPQEQLLATRGRAAASYDLGGASFSEIARWLVELDLARSVFQTYLRWLNRTEKALSREMRAGEQNTWGS